MTEQQQQNSHNSHKPPKCKSSIALEREYWSHMAVAQVPLYGVNISGTLFDKECHEWNFNKLGTIWDNLVEDTGWRSVEGVTSPFLYFVRTKFAWHSEDYDLYSISYIHLRVASAGMPSDDVLLTAIYMPCRLQFSSLDDFLSKVLVGNKKQLLKGDSNVNVYEQTIMTQQYLELSLAAMISKTIYTIYKTV